MGIDFQKTTSGLYIPSHIKPKSKRPTIFSFFAGCGGMDLGFLQAGCEVVGANEYEPEPSLTYMVNLCSYPVQIHYIGGTPDKERLNTACEKYIFGNKKKSGLDFKKWYQEHDIASGLYNRAIGSGFAGSGWIRHNPEIPPVRNFWFGDVRKLKGKDILDSLGMKPGDLDCVCGGPPCQGFSTAGKQNIADPRNNLVYEFGRMIVELQPKTFVMEEVPAIVDFMDPDGVLVLDKFAMMIAEGGYGKWEHIKRGMLIQAGCAGGIKGMRGNTKLKKSSPARKAKESKETGAGESQMALF